MLEARARRAKIAGANSGESELEVRQHVRFCLLNGSRRRRRARRGGGPQSDDARRYETVRDLCNVELTAPESGRYHAEIALSVDHAEDFPFVRQEIESRFVIL